MNYRKIDFSTWERAEKYKYFMTSEPCVLSLTCDVDVTDFASFCKRKGLKFYTAFICAVSRVINGDEHYRMGKDAEGNVIVFDEMDPLFTDFVPEGETFNNLTTPYRADAKEMYANVTAVREKYRGLEVMYPEEATPNMFSITCLPWISYNTMELHYKDNENMLFPIVAWGKYKMKEGRLMMPLTMRIHHAVCDGYHAAKFFTEVERVLPEIMNELA